MTQAISVDRRDFYRGLELAASVIDKRAQNEIFSTVKVTANGALRIEATNLDTATSVDLPYEGAELPPFFLRHPKKVAAALKRIGGDAVNINRPDEKTAAIFSGQMQAAIGAIPDDESTSGVPVLWRGEDGFVCDLGEAELKQIARVIPAISTEETRYYLNGTRYYLNGICIEKVGEWDWRFVATDGCRLMMVDVPLPGAVGEIGHRSILPRRLIQLVLAHFRKTPDPVQFGYGRRTGSNQPDATLAPEDNLAREPVVSFAGKVGDIPLTLTGKLIDGTFPDYTRVVPAGRVRIVRVERAALLNALAGLMPLHSGRTRAVKIEAEPGALRVSVDCPDIGKAGISIAAEHDCEPGFLTGFNGHYLLDSLRALQGEEVEFGWAIVGPGNRVVISDPADTAFKSVLMPMRW